MKTSETKSPFKTDAKISNDIEFRIGGITLYIIWKTLRELGYPLTKRFIANVAAKIRAQYPDEDFWSNKTFWAADVWRSANRNIPIYKHRTISDHFIYCARILTMARVATYNPKFSGIFPTRFTRMWKETVYMYGQTKWTLNDVCKEKMYENIADINYVFKKLKASPIPDKGDESRIYTIAKEKFRDMYKDAIQKNAAETYWRTHKRNNRHIREFCKLYKEELEKNAPIFFRTKNFYKQTGTRFE